MASVVERAVRTLRGLGVPHEASDDEVVVPATSADGFDVRLRMIHAREFLVCYDQWRLVVDRAEDAYDCFEYGLSDSCRLKVTLRGESPVAWQVEKREYGMWVPSRHATKRRLVAFWRPARTTYRQNTVFSGHAHGPRHDQPAPVGV